MFAVEERRIIGSPALILPSIKTLAKIPSFGIMQVPNFLPIEQII